MFYKKKGKMTPPYHGPERRIHSDDHDTIITLLGLIDSHVKNYNQFRDDFKEHKQEDNTSFNKIISKLEKQDDALADIKRIVYIGAGILIALNSIPTITNIIKALHGG